MPDTIAHYKLLERIGSGRMGELYRARDTVRGRTVAIRVVSPAIAADPAEKHAFCEAAAQAAPISHPNIAAVYEAGESGGCCYLASEFVTGVPLENVVGGRPLNPRRALEFGTQLADALADAHAAGLIHGDLNGRSVFVTTKGGAKILDFAFSRWTTTGFERKTASAQDDIHGLGVLLLMMLTGKPAFGIRTVSAIDPGVPKELDAVVLRASSTNPTSRFGSAAALSAELRSVAAILDVRAETSAPAEYVASGFGRAKRGSVGKWLVGWLAGLLLLGALGWIVWLAARAT